MTIDNVIWPLQPHTKAKHEILKYYLGAWFPILGTIHGRILYVDGFAGPGEYDGGEPGSPIVALEVAKGHILGHKFRNQLVFLFIEIEDARCEHLQRKVGEMILPPNFKVGIVRDAFEKHIGSILTEMEAGGSQLAPSFFFIDPFGPAGFTMNLIQRIANQQRSEVLITFNYQPLNQWFLQDPSKHSHLDSLFGSKKWRNALDIRVPKEKEEYLRATYQEALEGLGWRVRPFCMINKHNQTQYYLFFATKNPLGMLAMKRAMWKAAPTGDFQYSDLSNPSQPYLLETAFQEDYARQLADSLCEDCKGQTLSKKRITRDHLAWHPVCIERHLTKALRILENETDPPKIVKVEERKKRGTYPDGCKITFAS